MSRYWLALLVVALSAPAVPAWAATRGTPTCLGQPATMVVTPGVALTGTPGPDVIVGTAEDDVIRGAAGNDRICAGGGDDEVYGGGGADSLRGGGGKDALVGGSERDSCLLGSGDGTYLSCERPSRTPAISIEDFSFGPTITRPVGTEVLVTNLDPESHTWTSTIGAFNSGRIRGPVIFSHRFTEAGTYRFFCIPHPDMRGSIIIEERTP